jgi:hypothetical protein
LFLFVANVFAVALLFLFGMRSRFLREYRAVATRAVLSSYGVASHVASSTRLPLLMIPNPPFEPGGEIATFLFEVEASKALEVRLSSF